MIELAPGHKQGLPLGNPVMLAAGCAGFGSEYRPLLDFAALGALVTNPLTLAPRKPAHTTQVVSIEGGLLVHNGLPNPGLSRTLRQHGRQWQRLGCPVIVHLAADTPANMAACLDRLEEARGVSGIEVGFRDDESPEVAAELIAAAVGELPVIVRAPFGRGVEFAQLARQAGAQAVTVSAPPRGTIPAPDESGGWLSGRLYSPAHFPQTLAEVRAVAQQTRLPLVGAGGVFTPAQARALLAAGARAVQVGGLLWHNPAGVNALAAALAPDG